VGEGPSIVSYGYGDYSRYWVCAAYSRIHSLPLGSGRFVRQRYSSTRSYPWQNDSTYTNAPRTLYNAMQQHLCRILAHYTVYLGTKLGLPIFKKVEPFILDAAHSMWNKESRFVWITADESACCGGR
jgi:hypothetical protein